MVAGFSLKRLSVAIAPAAALVVGGLVAATMLVMPTDLLEGLVIDSGLPAVLAAAAPPLGFTARIALAAVIGGGTALITWFALFLMFGTRAVTIDAAGAAVRRRADAHPDAPPRRPLFANADLGMPSLEPRVEPASVREAERPAAPEPAAAPLPAVDAQPADPDPPLAASAPAEPPKPAALPWPPVLQAGAEPPPRSPHRHEPPATIHTLLDRLERGMSRPAAPPQPMPRAEQGLRDALESLRRLAADAR